MLQERNYGKCGHINQYNFVIFLSDVELKERIIAWKREKRDKKLQLSLNPNVKS